jgi:hypothetical protein
MAPGVFGLAVDPFPATLKECGSKDMALDGRYERLLVEVDGLTLRDGHLRLSIGGEAVMEFVEH